MHAVRHLRELPTASSDAAASADSQALDSPSTDFAEQGDWSESAGPDATAWVSVFHRSLDVSLSPDAAATQATGADAATDGTASPSLLPPARHALPCIGNGPASRNADAVHVGDPVFPMPVVFACVNKCHAGDDRAMVEPSISSFTSASASADELTPANPPSHVHITTVAKYTKLTREEVLTRLAALSRDNASLHRVLAKIASGRR
uniref:Uncharacterized protein n=1 Tax=Neobodo designis TaxID=312471 RepID=A0A7S1M186_NEODS|mmetsp:Transcript_32367/g.100139  ORF Transcript_32367/g.100139 Transcript_32367/m.100139 type:complete len:206 (+) Transcript_32367:121-738(+)|eukprot:CAMPEP_0174856768 /NCGR_PEP_ID=MMETSP1114-20130205/36209_1 /TAXON_ID=312471 /ORGANISM="Neobodo designis, Strain CCAP 1951/1" /LENGTH=205 /DNA_ID=CAMNT_0016091573 /DNA_START=86 /DNA_END=703 /DNA_ORIENTATION=-